MFRATPAVVQALSDLLGADAVAPLRDSPRSDATSLLLQAAALHEVLPRSLEAAAVRACCQRLGELHGGRSIELRVPPYAAVQLGFGNGPTHTRGTPPNLVEMDAKTFLHLATGRDTFADAKVHASGAHAHEVAQAFPLT